MIRFITNFLEPFSYLIYVIAVSIRLTKDQSLQLKMLLVFYLVATALMTDASFKVFTQVTNLWAYNSLLLMALLAIGFYYFNVLITKVKKGTALLFLAIAVLYFIVHNFIFKKFSELDSIGLVLLSVLVAVCSFMFFHQILSNVKEAKIFYDFNFWLTSGYMVYYLGSFFIFLYYNYFTHKIASTRRPEDIELLNILWGVHNVFLFLGAVITLFGSLWTTYRNRFR